MEIHPNRQQLVVKPIPANQQQQQQQMPSQSPQQPIFCTFRPNSTPAEQQGTQLAQGQQQSGMAFAQQFFLNQVSPQQLQQLKQMGCYVILTPAAAAAAASTPATSTTRAGAKPRRGCAAKKVVQKPKPHLHANSICTNCYTTVTTMWRRSLSGQTECNSCNLYWRSHGVPRPLELAGREIRTRKRVKPAPTSGSPYSPGEGCRRSTTPADYDHDYLGRTTPNKKARFVVPVSTSAAAQHYQPVPQFESGAGKNHERTKENDGYSEECLKWEAELHEEHLAEMQKGQEKQSMGNGGSNDGRAGGGMAVPMMKTKEGGQDARGALGEKEEVWQHGWMEMGDQQVVQQEEVKFYYEDEFYFEDFYFQGK